MTYFITRIKVVFFTFSLLLQLHCLFLLQFHVWSDLPSILVNARLRAQGDLGIRESAGVFITVGLEHACWVILVADLSACFVGGHLALPSQSCLQSWCHRGLQSQIWKWSSFSWWFIGRWESWGRTDTSCLTTTFYVLLSQIFVPLAWSPVKELSTVMSASGSSLYFTAAKLSLCVDEARFC